VRAEADGEELAAYCPRVLDDEAACERLLLRLGRRGDGMFHDPDFLLGLRQEVVPILRTHPSVRIWHAECGTGEAVYATAIVLLEEGLYDRTRIYATDGNEAALALARAGRYPAAQLERDEDGYRRAGGRSAFAEYYAVEGDTAVMRPLLQGRITFGVSDLGTDASFNEFHLILCRDALLSFNPPLAERAFGVFHDSLGRFGMLGLGRGESLRLHPQRDAYEPLPRPAKLFRRLR
jgi:chemotaxis protein methyltransferase CheR